MKEERKVATPGKSPPRSPARKGVSGRSRSVKPNGTARDPDTTRLRILEAAMHEFAAHGLAGARVDRIAARSGANKGMLYYYFGDKDDLFGSVLEHVYLGIRSAEQGLRLLDHRPVEAVTRLIEFTWRYYLEHPEFLTLLNSENLHRARHLKRSRNIRATNLPIVETLTEILRRGEAEGIFRSGVDPVQLYISIAGLSYFYLSNNHSLSEAFARDFSTARQRAARLAHMITLVIGFLTGGEKNARG